jgi:hypothetical protein
LLSIRSPRQQEWQKHRRRPHLLRKPFRNEVPYAEPKGVEQILSVVLGIGLTQRPNPGKQLQAKEIANSL